MTILRTKSCQLQKDIQHLQSDAETLEQRNHRILLCNVDNEKIKGVLDDSQSIAIFL